MKSKLMAMRNVSFFFFFAHDVTEFEVIKVEEIIGDRSFNQIIALFIRSFNIDMN